MAAKIKPKGGDGVHPRPIRVGRNQPAKEGVGVRPLRTRGEKGNGSTGQEKVTEEYTVENLSPRARPVKSLEMSIRSAQAVAQLCETALGLAKGDPELARSDDYNPIFWRDSKMAPTGLGKLLDDAQAGVWGMMSWSQWFDLWANGGLRGQVQDLAGNLPKEVRDKYVG